MTLYQLVLYLHVLGFGLWLGAIVVGTIMWRRRLGADPAALSAATSDWRAVDRFLTEPAAIVVLLAGGYLMTAGGFDFDTAIWIHIGFGALVASVGLSIVGVGLARRAILRGRGGSGLVARATWSAVGAALLILVGLWAMIARPVV